MSKIGVWHIQSQGPVKLRESNMDLEKHLEDWIESDPSLLRSGLVIVGRQSTLPGGRLDLLALDPQGSWVIIEIKAGPVYSETVGQVLYYAATISRMPFAELKQKVDGYLQPRGRSLEALLKERGIEKADQEGPRDIQTMLVGAGMGIGLDRVVAFLVEDFEFPITVVSFDVYETASGERVLVRELTEADTLPVQAAIGAVKRPAATFDQLVSVADRHAAGQLFRRLYDAATQHGFHFRLYPTSIMYAPPRNKTRMLSVWVEGKLPGVLKTYIAPEVFAEFYPVSEEQALNLLGPSGWRQMDSGAVDQFIAGLDQLFSTEVAENA